MHLSYAQQICCLAPAVLKEDHLTVMRSMRLHLYLHHETLLGCVHRRLIQAVCMFQVVHVQGGKPHVSAVADLLMGQSKLELMRDYPMCVVAGDDLILCA